MLHNTHTFTYLSFCFTIIGKKKKAKAIMSKIASIATGFRLAVDYRNNTGQGVDSNNPEEWDQFFNNTVLRVCPSYNILEDTLLQYPNAVAACVL